MKIRIRLIGKANSIIKKYFFNRQKNDICHDCESVINLSPVNNENEVDEYLKNYQSTTRWQTL